VFRIRPLPALLATFIAASCTDDSNPTAPRTEQRAPKPNLTAYLVTVAGPTVLNVTGGFHTSANGINATSPAPSAVTYGSQATTSISSAAATRPTLRAMRP